MTRQTCLRKARAKWGRNARLTWRDDVPAWDSQAGRDAWLAMKQARHLRRRINRLFERQHKFDPVVLTKKAMLRLRRYRRPGHFTASVVRRVETEIRDALCVSAKNLYTATILSAAKRAVAQIHRIEERGDAICPDTTKWNCYMVRPHRCSIGVIMNIGRLARFNEIKGEGDTWDDAWARAEGRLPRRSDA